MFRKPLLVVVSLLSLVAPVLFVGCQNQQGGSSVNPESFARDFAAAVFAGRADEAKAMMLPRFDGEATFASDTDRAISVFSQYETRDVKLLGIRPWSAGGRGESDKRADIQFDYRKKGTSDDWKSGLLYVRVTSVESRWGITDAILGLPSQ